MSLGECLDNLRSSEKQEGGQSLKDIFVLLLCSFFFFLLGVGDHYSSVFS